MEFAVRWHDQIDEIPKDDWNRLALPLETPFLEWEWLHALEATECVAPKKGWQPLHLSLSLEDKLVAAAPLYIKAHSRGEFVFDQEWAQVSESLGIAYYPKLLGMSPFTPAPGYQFLLDPEHDPDLLCKLMMQCIDHLCKENKINGCHFLHTDDDWAQRMESLGLSPWVHHHLVWENHHYESFDDYLAHFSSKQRKNIKRERRIVAEQDIQMTIIPGQQAEPELYDAMFQFYADTCLKFWNWSRYLNREFFQHIGQHFAHRILFAAAYEGEDDPKPKAMSFFVHKGENLHGRYWGSHEQFDQLHFETCYYQPIQWAIENGVRHFDAGSGNARHKKRRGFPARPNRSLHRFYHPQLSQLWNVNIERINQLELEQIAHINGESLTTC